MEQDPKTAAAAGTLIGVALLLAMRKSKKDKKAAETAIPAPEAVEPGRKKGKRDAEIAPPEAEAVMVCEPAEDRTVKELVMLLLKYALKPARKRDKPLPRVLLLFLVEKLYRQMDEPC
ncbi:MAG: hypothetical protein ACYC3G_04690 [Minisyncoccota bacterium]